MRKISGVCFVVLAVATVLTACNNDEKKATLASPISEEPVLTPPIRFHKLVEVSPGQDYDVLSWGRGQTKTGSFVILHSDSAAAKYTTTSNDLEGEIIDVYNTDMDLDGNPEILVQTKTADTVNYTGMYAFEFTNGHAEKLDFPKLTKSQRQGYRGEDNFYTKTGVLMREFPIYTLVGKDYRPSGKKRLFEYGLRNNSFTIKQVSKDSVDTKAAVVPAPVIPAKKTTTTDKPQTHSSSTNTSHKKKKKHVEEEVVHKKKHKKHHHSDDN